MVPAWAPRGWTPDIATPLDYLIRFDLHNRVFLDDVRLEGIILADEDSQLPGAIGNCSIVISQRWLVAAEPENPYPTESEIEIFMRQLGFEPLPNSFFGWLREADGILILDAKHDNFIQTTDGLLPFDLLMAQCR